MRRLAIVILAVGLGMLAGCGDGDQAKESVANRSIEEPGMGSSRPRIDNPLEESALPIEGSVPPPVESAAPMEGTAPPVESAEPMEGSAPPPEAETTGPLGELFPNSMEGESATDSTGSGTAGQGLSGVGPSGSGIGNIGRSGSGGIGSANIPRMQSIGRGGGKSRGYGRGSKKRMIPQSSGKSFTKVRVFYATDREPTGSTEPKNFYGNKQGPLSLGFCDVSIPARHQSGELEAPSIWKFEFREDPEKHVVLMNVEPAIGPKYLAELRRSIAESYDPQTETGGEAFLFVHGFNVTFEDAARRTAQIAFDLEFPGAPIMYSWPTQGRPGLLAYRSDAKTSQSSEPNVTEFITEVARRSGARKIHLIAHSMGNRIVTGALKRLAESGNGADTPRFNEVILTAPDIDANTFKNEIAPKIVQSADHITIYASSNDMALMASSLVNRLGKARLGQGGRDLSVFPEFRNIEVIDASDVDTSLFRLKHSYHADSSTVLADIRLVLAGRRAVDRGLSSIREELAWKIKGQGGQLGNMLDRLRR